MAAEPSTAPVSEPLAPAQKLSILHGPRDPPLVDLSLGELLELQTYQHGTKECLVIPWTGARWTYNELNQQSLLLAQALLEMGIKAGDRVGVMAGNCEQYAAIFFAVSRIGAILVILNNTYTPSEAMYAVEFSECKILFTTKQIGRLDNTKFLSQIANKINGPKIIMIRGDTSGYQTYDDLIKSSSRQSPRELHLAMSKVVPHQVCNLQFTSGTTGRPKAAMLTSIKLIEMVEEANFGFSNVVNNARFIGDRMRLTPDDVLCCPPPLFHCFGLVLGLLSVITHGAKIVYPAEVFDTKATLKAILEEDCTALHGVPAMFDSLFQAAPDDFKSSKIRTGIVAGAPVPRYLMELMVNRLGMREFTSSYGLTEASPTCFNAFTDDALGKRLTTVGTLMPHASAKIVDRDGNVVPMGQRGELCMAGYQLQAGYWNNSEKTNEVMVRDSAGVLWLHTGDEAVFDDAGYCSITGRFKDIIIRGGENIYPLEIEERLMAHPSISQAIVVGLKDEHYGEVVGAFVQRAENADKPSFQELKDWVRQRLGGHKSPAHIFWLGEDGVPANVPLTGSGKVRKFEIAKVGDEILKKSRTVSAKL
ncbi:AMP-binding enzyme [Colletotrichum scovillei]|uniref:AMP-binding enzyme n=1 Tax=Colletotrichum scovillei TaxID=1209932 RepID=A0A9P7R378_9PEZI|nr:AMP-binding enzyme [Colletotrichum scovillei]KAG7060186.1 AMP-binding enzyme [Colletotrichum scovillei]KAG7067607.1 AMP-binding enzyme [Colletotrichum scovillei]